MNTPNDHVARHLFPIEEFDFVETSLQSLRPLVKLLEERQAVLIEMLDRETRPDEPLTRTKLMRSVARGFWYKGTVTQCDYAIDVYIGILRRLWVEYPTLRGAMARALSRKGRTRTYVATTSSGLFRDQTEEWAGRHCRVLADDWYVDTNLNPQQMRKLLCAAVQAVGLKWGKDVKAVWNSTWTYEASAAVQSNHGYAPLSNAARHL